MPVSSPGWVAPGLVADPSRWRWAAHKKRGWIAPGEDNPRTPQPLVVMPPGFDPRSRDAGFRIVVSPPGTMPPEDALTYTPETGAFWQPGDLEPPPLDRTNLSLVTTQPPALPMAGPGLSPGLLPGGPGAAPGGGGGPPGPGQVPTPLPMGPDGMPILPPGGGPPGPPGGGPPGGPGSLPPMPPMAPGGAGMLSLPPGMPPIPGPPMGPGPGGPIPNGPAPPAPGSPMGMGQDRRPRSVGVGQGGIPQGNPSLRDTAPGAPEVPVSPIVQTARDMWTQMMVATGLVGPAAPPGDAMGLGQDQPVGVGQAPGSPEEAALHTRLLRERIEPHVNTRYVLGGNSLTQGIDCSGFVNEILKGFGYPIRDRPTTVTYRNQLSTPVSWDAIRPGDILLSPANPGDPVSGEHMGLYLGAGLFAESTGARGPNGQMIGVRIRPVEGTTMQPRRMREPVPGLQEATRLAQASATESGGPTVVTPNSPNNPIAGVSGGDQGFYRDFGPAESTDAAFYRGTEPERNYQGNYELLSAGRQGQTPQQRGIVQLALDAGANPELATIMATSALLESSGNPLAQGDGGAAQGLYQMHSGGAGAGMSVEARRDPVNATNVMYRREFLPAYNRLKAQGLSGLELARAVYLAAERPDMTLPQVQQRVANELPRHFEAVSRAVAEGSDVAVGDASRIPLASTNGQPPTPQPRPAQPPAPMTPDVLAMAQEAINTGAHNAMQLLGGRTAYAAETDALGPGATISQGTTPQAAAPTPRPYTQSPGQAPAVGPGTIIGGAVAGATAAAGAAPTPAAGPGGGYTQSPGQAPPMGATIQGAVQGAQQAAAGQTPQGPTTALPAPQPTTPTTTGGLPTYPPQPQRTERAAAMGVSDTGRPPMTPEQFQGNVRFQAAIGNLERRAPQGWRQQIERQAITNPDQVWASIEQEAARQQVAAVPRIVEKDGYAFAITEDGTAQVLPANARGQQIQRIELPGGRVAVARPGEAPVIFDHGPDGSLWRLDENGANPEQIIGARDDPQRTAALEHVQAQTAQVRAQTTASAQSVEESRARIANENRAWNDLTANQAAQDQRTRDRLAYDERNAQLEREAANLRHATASGNQQLQAETELRINELNREQREHERRTLTRKELIEASQPIISGRTVVPKTEEGLVNYEGIFQLPAEELTKYQEAQIGISERAQNLAEEESKAKRAEALLPYERMTKVQEAENQVRQGELGVSQQRAATERELGMSRLGLEREKFGFEQEVANRPKPLQLEHGGVGSVDPRTGAFTLRRGEQPYLSGGDVVTPPGSWTRIDYGGGRTVDVGSPGIGYAGHPGMPAMSQPMGGIQGAFGGTQGYSGFGSNLGPFAPQGGGYGQMPMMQQGFQRPQMGWPQQQPQQGYGMGGGGWLGQQYQRGWGMGQDRPASRQRPKGRGGWSPPVDPRSVVGTGHRWMEPVSQEGEHRGLDLQAVRGTPVLSPTTGHVTNVSFDPEGLGLQVEVTGRDGWGHRMSHLDAEQVDMGQPVGQGQQVGNVGSTGASTGPHLDQRLVTPKGQLVDPSGWLGPLARMPRADRAGATGAGAGREQHYRDFMERNTPRAGYQNWEALPRGEPITLYRGEYGGQGTTWTGERPGRWAIENGGWGMPGGWWTDNPDVAQRFARPDTPPSHGGYDPTPLYKLEIPAERAHEVVRHPFPTRFTGEYEYFVPEHLRGGRKPLMMSGVPIADFLQLAVLPEEEREARYRPAAGWALDRLGEAWDALRRFDPSKMDSRYVGAGADVPRFAAEGAQGTPGPYHGAWNYDPLPESGTIRLYRGESGNWEADPGHRITTRGQERQGRWFIDNPSSARNYAFNNRGGEGVVYYADVPADVARKSLYEALPHGHGREFLLPEEFTRTKRPLAMSGVPMADFMQMAVLPEEEREARYRPAAGWALDRLGEAWDALRRFDPSKMDSRYGRGQAVGAGADAPDIPAQFEQWLRGKFERVNPRDMIPGWWSTGFIAPSGSMYEIMNPQQRYGKGGYTHADVLEQARAQFPDIADPVENLPEALKRAGQVRYQYTTQGMPVFEVQHEPTEGQYRAMRQVVGHSPMRGAVDWELGATPDVQRSQGGHSWPSFREALRASWPKSAQRFQVGVPMADFMQMAVLPEEEREARYRPAAGWVLDRLGEGWDALRRFDPSTMDSRYARVR